MIDYSKYKIIFSNDNKNYFIVDKKDTVYKIKKFERFYFIDFSKECEISKSKSSIKINNPQFYLSIISNKETLFDHIQKHLITMKCVLVRDLNLSYEVYNSNYIFSNDFPKLEQIKDVCIGETKLLVDIPYNTWRENYTQNMGQGMSLFGKPVYYTLGEHYMCDVLYIGSEL